MSAGSVISGELKWYVQHSPCLELLKSLPDESIDSMVADPPAGISFMNRVWDKDKGGRDEWIAWLTEILTEAVRVLKPGAHVLLWSLPRTQHWTGMAMENAGLVIRDGIDHIFSSGFPKSLSISKQFDPESEEAAEFAGLGTALKPSRETWILARKPLCGTVAENVKRYGTGALNIDGCRIAHASPEDLAAHVAQVDAIKARGGSMEESWKNSSDLSGASDVSAAGRWPANTVFSHSSGCVKAGSFKIGSNPTWDTPNRETESGFTGKKVSRVRHNDVSTNFAMQAGESIGEEIVADWHCVPSCAVALLNKQGPGNGTTSRFFAQFELEDFDFCDPFICIPKPSRSEKDMGLDDFESVSGGEATGRKDGSKGVNNPRAGSGRTGGSKNVHPTSKGLNFMRYLCRLVTPKNGICMDIFLGGGTTGAAALLEGFRFIGAEINNTPTEPFVDIARARIGHVASGEYARNSVKKKLPAEVKRPGQQSLF